MGTSANDRRSQVMLGDLPANFLRVDGAPPSPQQQQLQTDAQTAQALQYQFATGGAFGAATSVPRLSVTIAQAKLTKNYGIVKMDPYCRIRVAHSVFETHTCNSGGKNPRWNKVFHCHVPQGIDSMYIEIFDEKAFTTDDKVAWSHITIPEKVFAGDTVEEWFPLNGRQGDSREGMVQIVFTYNKNPAPVAQPMMYNQPVMYVGGVPGAMPVYYPQQQPQGNKHPQGIPVYYPQQQPQVQQPQQPQQPQGPLFTEDDVKQVKDMFPSVDEEVIKSVLEANRGNKDATINNLLGMES